MSTQDLEQIEALLHEWEQDQDETSTYACHPEQALADMRALVEVIQQNYEKLYELRTKLAFSTMALARGRRNMEEARTILAREDGGSWADAIEDADDVLRAAIGHSRSRADLATRSEPLSLDELEELLSVKGSAVADRDGTVWQATHRVSAAGTTLMRWRPAGGPSPETSETLMATFGPMMPVVLTTPAPDGSPAP